jgi:hypothetical protein
VSATEEAACVKVLGEGCSIRSKSCLSVSG